MRWIETDSHGPESRRTNEMGCYDMIRDQEVGGSNPLAPIHSKVNNFRLPLSVNTVIRQLNGLSEKRRSFKRGLWGSCVATLMPHNGDSVIEARCSPSSLIPSHVAKDRFGTDYPPQKKPPACA